METKICTRCKEEQDIAEFCWKNKTKGLRHAYCKKCKKLYNQEHYRNNGEMYRAKARRYEETNGGRLYITYKITEEQYAVMLAKYNGKCWICKKNPGNAVDHDHNCCPGLTSCGNCIRGILCINCNTGIGCLKDSPEVLLSAIEYLKINNMTQ